MSPINYLALINSALNTDLFVMWFVVFRHFKSKMLREWYKLYNLGAVLADVLSLTIGLIIAFYIYPLVFSTYSIYYFSMIAVVVQICHDLLFSFFFNLVPRGRSRILDTFKDYAKELGVWILLGDSLMIIGTIILYTFFQKMSIEANIISLIVSLYFVPYLLYSI